VIGDAIDNVEGELGNIDVLYFAVGGDDQCSVGEGEKTVVLTPAKFLFVEGEFRAD